MTRGITNPLGLDILDATGYVTGQQDLDEDHVAALADAMRTHGWQGPPLVVLPDYAISYSGTHRLAAAELAGLDEVPGVDLRDLFTAAGLDLDEICDDEDLSLLVDRPEIIRHLPNDIATTYAVDDIN